jgi:hypothetical protein
MRKPVCKRTRPNKANENTHQTPNAAEIAEPTKTKDRPLLRAMAVRRRGRRTT